MTTTARTSTPLEQILGRSEHAIDLSRALQALRGGKLLITGADGSIGEAIFDRLYEDGQRPTHSDIDTMDVRDAADVLDCFKSHRPTIVLHLAGAKHAPQGETNPAETFETNVIGTQNVLSAASAVGARVITASTCKACNPQTVYGATKLIAERMTLEAGGTVARFHNVVESSGNVFRIWEDLPEHAMIPVTPCSRYFITLAEATALVLTAATLEPGRYCVNPGRRPRPMPSVAAGLYPDRPQDFIPARRGDRLNEPMLADEERATPVSEWMWRIDSPYDRVSA